MHFMAGALTAHLLTSDKKPNIIHINHSTPLNKEQADLYMTTDEYETNLYLRCISLFKYLDRNNNFQPRLIVNKITGEKRTISRYHVEKLIDREASLKKRSDEVILLTKGIDALPKGHVYKQKDLIDKICLYILCFPCSPFYCIRGRDCESGIVELDKGYSDVEVDQAGWDFIKKI